MNRFELVDASEEGYQSLGSFPTREKAIEEIKSATKNGPEGVTDIIDDEVTFKIIEHPDGWGQVKWVWSQTWLATYSDGCDSPVWAKESELKTLTAS
jgi:hypothetical protein